MGHPSSAVPKRRSRGTSSGCRGSRRAVLVPGIIVFPGLPRFKLDVAGDPGRPLFVRPCEGAVFGDRKSTRLNSSHSQISYAVFCLKKKKDRMSRTIAAIGRFVNTPRGTLT